MASSTYDAGDGVVLRDLPSFVGEAVSMETCFCKIRTPLNVGGKFGCGSVPVGLAQPVALVAGGAKHVCHATDQTRRGDAAFARLMERAEEFSAHLTGFMPQEVGGLATGKADFRAFGKGYCHLKVFYQSAYFRLARVIGTNPGLADVARAFRLAGRGRMKRHKLIEVAPGFYHVCVDSTAKGMDPEGGKKFYAEMMRVLAACPSARVGATLEDVRAVIEKELTEYALEKYGVGVSTSFKVVCQALGPNVGRNRESREKKKKRKAESVERRGRLTREKLEAEARIAVVKAQKDLEVQALRDPKGESERKARKAEARCLAQERRVRSWGSRAASESSVTSSGSSGGSSGGVLVTESEVVELRGKVENLTYQLEAQDNCLAEMAGLMQQVAEAHRDAASKDDTERLLEGKDKRIKQLEGMCAQLHNMYERLKFCESDDTFRDGDYSYSDYF